MTGRRARTVAATAVVEAHGERITRAATFSDVKPGAPFWYENSNGLVEPGWETITIQFGAGGYRRQQTYSAS